MPLPAESPSSLSALSYRPGERLRETRERAGVPAEQVAAELGLLPAVLAALEADDYAVLPEPVFIRGYMKRYAARLGLPPEELAERFDDFYQSKTGRSPEASLRPNPVRVLGELNDKPRRRRGVRWKWIGRALGLGLVIALVTVAVRLAPTAGQWSWPGRAPSSTPVAETTQALTGAATLPAMPDKLLLQLQGDSQISVHDADGRELASGLHKAGEELAMEGSSPFSIELKPASAVRLQFNGQPIDLGPYTVNDIVNFRLSR